MTGYEKLCDFENLYRAHLAARRNKRYKFDVMAFEADLAANLWRMKAVLEQKTYCVGKYHHFTIHDPKTRDIQALPYEDRVLQHCLCDNVLAPVLENHLIYDNCACRVEKGTHFGMDRLSGFMRQHYKKHGAAGWFLKADVRKYFEQIDHAVLKSQLMQCGLEQDILDILDVIIHSHNAHTGKGLPMGNQTSQWFSLLYLNPVDRLVKEKLRVKHYTRYMDDMVLLHPDKAFLQYCLCQMRMMVEDELKLELNEKTQLFPVQNGVDYLGWHFYLSDTGKVVKRLRQTGKQRFKRRVKQWQTGYAKGSLEIEDINRSMVSMNGHLAHGNTWRLRQQIYGNMVLKRKKNFPKLEEEDR